MTTLQRLQNQLIARQLREYIEQELAYFCPGGDQPPENEDVWKGLDRAEIAISRAFRTFHANHCTS